MRNYFIIIIIIASMLSGCATVTHLSPLDVQNIRNNSEDGLLLLSLGRIEKPLPYLPIVYYKVLCIDSDTNKMKTVANLKSEVMDIRYFNGNHFSGTGKQSVVHLLKLPAGTYFFSGYERETTGYLPISGCSGTSFIIPNTRKIRILYRIKVCPGILNYGGELITNSRNLGSNDSVTVYDEFERDYKFIAQSYPEISNLEITKSIATPANGKIPLF